MLLLPLIDLYPKVKRRSHDLSYSFCFMNANHPQPIFSVTQTAYANFQKNNMPTAFFKDVKPSFTKTLVFFRQRLRSIRIPLQSHWLGGLPSTGAARCAYSIDAVPWAFGPPANSQASAGFYHYRFVFLSFGTRWFFVDVLVAGDVRHLIL